MTRTHHDAFMEAIVEEPDNDFHRLVYADWLEDHGDPARAEFIRLQCWIHTAERPAPLLSRARELRARHFARWTSDLPGTPVQTHKEALLSPDDSYIVCFSRGFPAYVRGTAVAFMQLLPDIVKFETIVTSIVSDKVPSITQTAPVLYYWSYCDDFNYNTIRNFPNIIPDTIDREVYKIWLKADSRRCLITSPAWASEAKAINALCKAFFVWAKRQTKGERNNTTS